MPKSPFVDAAGFCDRKFYLRAMAMTATGFYYDEIMLNWNCPVGQHKEGNCDGTCLVGGCGPSRHMPERMNMAHLIFRPRPSNPDEVQECDEITAMMRQKLSSWTKRRLGELVDCLN